MLIEVHTILEGLPAECRVSASAFHDAAEVALRGAGYRVSREVPVATGRLDLLLDGWFGVELDSATCRARSIRKIARCAGGIVYCRNAR